jgi:hypothetical protein
MGRDVEVHEPQRINESAVKICSAHESPERVCRDINIAIVRVQIASCNLN